MVAAFVRWREQGWGLAGMDWTGLGEGYEIQTVGMDALSFLLMILGASWNRDGDNTATARYIELFILTVWPPLPIEAAWLVDVPPCGRQGRSNAATVLLTNL